MTSPRDSCTALVPMLLFALLAGCGASTPRPSFERFDFTVTPSPEDYPDVPAVVLLDRGDFRITIDPKVRTPLGRLRRMRRVKILRETGMGRARIEVPFDPGTVVVGLAARAVLTDGAIHEADPDEIREMEHSTGRRAKTFVVPNVEVGAVVEYIYDLIIDDLRFIPPWVFQSEIPTMRSEFAVVVPQGFNVDLRYSEEGAFVERPPERFDTEDGTRFFWSVSNLPARFTESHMPAADLLAPRAHVIFKSARFARREVDGFGSWDDVGTWFLKRVFEWDKLTPSTVAEAQRVAGETSVEEKSLRLLEVVARDLGWESGPHVPLWRARLVHPDIALKEKKGNRTSRGLLLVALLRAAGIPAVPALVAYREEDVLLPDIPTVHALDGVIAILPRPQGALILDPSQLTISGEVPSPGLQGTRIVALRGDIAEVLLVPESAPRDSRTEVTYDLKLDERGDLFGSIEARFTGAEAGALRAMLFEVKPEQYAEVVTTFITARGGGLPVESVSIADLKALRRPLSLKGTVNENNILPAEGTDVFLPIKRFVGATESAMREVRRTALKLSAPREVEVTVRLTLPEDYEHDVIAPTITESWTGGNVTLSMRAETRRRLGFSRKSTRSVLSVTARKYPSYRAFCHAVAAAEEQNFSFKRPPPKPTEY